MNATLVERLSHLTTAHLTDACLRTGVPIRCAPAGVRPMAPGMRCAGRARPVRQQLRFGEYLARRARDAGYSFRQHLRTIDAAVEE